MTSIPSSSKGQGPRKSMIQMNSCFICNLVFVAEKGASGRSSSTLGGVRIIEKLCTILEVSGIAENFTPEANPLCPKCCGMMDEFFNMERQLQFLIKMLWELRRMLGKKIVHGFNETEQNRKNFDVKLQIFEVWRQKVNAPPPQISSAQLNSLNNQQTDFASTVHSLNSVIKRQPVRRPRRSAPTTAAVESTDNPDPNYVLLDISNNNSVSSSTSNNHHDFIPEPGPPENVDNENSNLSMECPSPSSPVGFDDIGGESGGEDVYVSNLPEVAPETGSSSVTHTSSNQENGSLPQSAAGTGGTGFEDLVQFQQNSQANPETEAVTDKRRNRPIVVTHRRTHQCKHCGKLFPSNFAMELHARIHTGDKPFSCSICGRPFIAKAAMQKHEMTHDKTRYEGEPQYECDICGKKYHLRLSLYTHQRDHKGIKRPKKKRRVQNELKWPPKRNYKKKKIRDPNAPPKVKKVPKPRAPRPPRKRKVRLDADGNPIVRRRRRSPKPPSDKPKRRRICFAPRAPRRKRGAPKEPAICTYCGKDFIESYRLRAHLPVHTGEKAFKCPICDDRNFALKGNLDKHMKNMHESESRYEKEPAHICDYCGKGFYVLGTLYHHRRRRHLGMAEKYRNKKKEVMRRPGDCKKCGQKFSTTYALRHHELSHQEKRHKCSICERPFHTPGEAVDHATRHDPKWLYKTFFRYQCVGCPPEALGFPSKLALREHWVVAHVDQTMPEHYKKPKKKPRPPLPAGPGNIVCTRCPEECRPRYRQLTSLRKHERAYHAPNTNKVWKPNGEMGKKRKKKVQEIEEEEFNTSSEESESEQESDEFKSDSEKEESRPLKTEAMRRSVRQTRGNRVDLARLLNESDEESDIEDKLPIKQTSFPKSKTKPKVLPSISTQSRQKTAISLSSKWTDYYVNKFLKGRQVRLILTRTDQNCSDTKRQGSGNCKMAATSRPRPGPKSKTYSTSTYTNPTPYTVPRRGRVSPMRSLESKQAGTYALTEQERLHANVDQGASKAVSEDVPPEIKEEVDNEEGDEGMSELATPSRAQSIIPTHGRNFPMLIHNPLSKNKVANPIVIPPRSNQTASASSEPGTESEEMNRAEDNETVLGF